MWVFLLSPPSRPWLGGEHGLGKRRRRRRLPTSDEGQIFLPRWRSFA